MIILIILAYLIGCVLGYLVYKRTLKYYGTYTIKDRKRAIALSIFSWITVFTGISIIFWDWLSEENDTPAKW